MMNKINKAGLALGIGVIGANSISTVVGRVFSGNVFIVLEVVVLSFAVALICYDFE